MALDTNAPGPESTTDPAWDARLPYWRRRLGRLRLGVEPIDEQLARYRRATVLLTAIPFGIAMIFVSLFTAFRRPDVGLVLSGVLLAPIVCFAWLDYFLLKSRASAYLRDLREHQSRRPPTKTPGGA